MQAEQLSEALLNIQGLIGHIATGLTIIEDDENRRNDVLFLRGLQSFARQAFDETSELYRRLDPE